MTSRDAILAALRQNQPEAAPLPNIEAFPMPSVDLLAHFKGMIVEIGGRVAEVAAGEVAAAIAMHYPEARTIASATPAVEGTVGLPSDTDPHALADLDVFVCEGSLGVAESGAVWVSEAQMIHRAAPFLTQHLVLLLDRQKLVWNLHEAYAHLPAIPEGFGVFIAGPSKTADIEQSLVIGAHGPRSLTVLLVG